MQFQNRGGAERFKIRDYPRHVQFTVPDLPHCEMSHEAELCPVASMLMLEVHRCEERRRSEGRTLSSGDESNGAARAAVMPIQESVFVTGVLQSTGHVLAK
ncbi:MULTISPECIES: hypothetical protein [unclassified Streptomyces]|uniref:hypothetical protein n=1 Tax=unclassified Streptomyces TaxID=2593676 RepID=UPI00131D59B4|nr:MULTISPECIES: hypothetical protein [unclassified Streptomyces]